MLERFGIEDFDEIFDIMQESFPLAEYRTYDGQKALFERQRYNVCGIRINGEIAAFIAFWQDEGVVFIEHFAVRTTYRNHGLGGKALRELIELNRGRLVCLEVEPPENDIAKRRIAFYERNGLFLNSHPYMQPSLSVGRPPLPLMIMTSGRQIDADEFARLKNTLYKSFYKSL